MSKVEIESFVKSFVLFFVSLSILMAILLYLNYLKEVKTLDEHLFSQMRVCSFDLKCTNFSIDFEPIQKQELYSLYKNEKGLDAFFPISKADDYYLVLHFDNEKYIKEINLIEKKISVMFIITISIVFILSILFSLYALSPLRSALLLTQEFIKDILHDVNTPLSSLQINSFMLKREIGENEKVLRIEQGIQNILSLQDNLKAYLFNYQQKKESVDVKELLNGRIKLIYKNYEDISFELKMEPLVIEINRGAFERVCDNIITNAAKYNKKNGTITITYNRNNKILSIKDTGKGIENPSKIFDRFYKEQERGVGIGLHIVKKLCDELKINIRVESKVNVGTDFSLVLTKY